MIHPPQTQSFTSAKSPQTTLKIIVVGLPRTGTISLKAALEHLGYGPCHHLLLPACQVSRVRKSVVLLKISAGYARQEALREFFAGYEVCLDMPGSACVDDLLLAFPDVKVILTVRTCPKLWLQSYRFIIEPLASLWFRVVGYWLPGVYWGGTMVVRWQNIVRDRFPGIGIPSTEMYDVHNAFVRAVTPLEKLLEFEPSHGWIPLCGFLCVPVPSVPFPRRNERRRLKRLHYSVYVLGILAWISVLWGVFATANDFLNLRWRLLAGNLLRYR